MVVLFEQVFGFLEQLSSWSSFLASFHFLGVGLAHTWVRLAHVATQTLRLGEGLWAVWTNCIFDNWGIFLDFLRLRGYFAAAFRDLIYLSFRAKSLIFLSSGISHRLGSLSRL